MSKPNYPHAEPAPETVTFANVSYEDPFRWLEDDNEKVLAWQSEQDALCQQYLKDLSAFPAAGRLLHEIDPEPEAKFLPKRAGDRWFRTTVPAGKDLAVLEVAATPDGAGRAVIDLNAMRKDQALAFNYWEPSPDGKKVVFSWSRGGRELENTQVIEVNTGKLLLDGLPQIRPTFPAWLPDSSGFVFTASDPDKLTQTRVFVHHLGRVPPQKPEPLELDHPVAMPRLSADGKHILLVMNHLSPRADYIFEPGVGWKDLLKGVSGTFRGDIVGSHFIAITDDGAPRGRVVSIPLASPTRRETWKELVPASENVLATLVVVDGLMVLVDIVDMASRIRVFEADGILRGEIPLPGRGLVNCFGGPMAALNLVDTVERAGGREIVFLFSSPAVSAALYSANVRELSLKCLTEPASKLDVQVHLHHGTSADGTQVPYHVVAGKDGSLSKPRPTLIFGYGGFGVAMLLGWPGSLLAAWIKGGGVGVIAHIRGGGELGPEWWLGGCLKLKQNSFNDVYAIAEDLIRRGITTPKQLGFNGGSNGGVVACVAAVQRPDLFEAVVPQVPITDILGRARDPITMAATLDFGNPDDPEMAPILRAWSPYQNISEGKAYPALLIDCGKNDPRCPPWHSRKYAARMQRATSSERPILLRVRDGAGHGAASSADRNMQNWEALAFFAHHLGLQI